MPFICENGNWREVKELEEIGRTDWHHNKDGKVDYLSLRGVSERLLPKSVEIPLKEQSYDIIKDIGYETGTQNLISSNRRKPDWKEYQRIQEEYN